MLQFDRFYYWSACLLVFLFFSPTLNAQKPGKYNWDKHPVASPAIPDAFFEEEAVVVTKKVIRSCNYENGKYRYKEIIYKRIKLMTANSIRKYARIKTPLKENSHLKYIDARTLKQTGAIVHLDSKDIKIINTTNIKVYKPGAYSLFAVPGVEPGDEIEIIICFESSQPHSGDDYYFYEPIPVIKSILKIELSDDFNIAFKEYNNLTPAAATYRWHGKEFYWVQNDLKGLSNQKNAIINLELPHLAYELDFGKIFSPNGFISEQETWIDLLEHIHRKEIQSNIKKPRILKDELTRIYGSERQNSSIACLQIFHNYINQEFKIRNLANTEKSQGIEYFLTKKESDQINLLRLYKHVLNTLGVPYFLAAGRERFDGPLDIEFPSSLQIGHLLFVILDEQGEVKLVIPKTEDRMFDLGQVPLALEGTKLFLFNPEDDKNLTTLETPISPATKNLIQHTYFIDLSLPKTTETWQVESIFNGHSFSQLRKFDESHLEKKYLHKFLGYQTERTFGGAQINDSLKVTTTEHGALLNYSFRKPATSKELTPNIWEISIQELLVNNFPKIDTFTQWVDYYIEYPYTDRRIYRLSFQEDIKLLDFDKNNCSLSNKYCSYQLTVKRIDKQLIEIVSDCVVNAEHIPVENFNEIQNFKDKLEELRLLKLIIKRTKK